MCYTQVEYPDQLVEDAERNGVEVPEWLQNAPDDIPVEAQVERELELWDGFTATEEGR